jgi:vacuolar-type H+-ATPase subunit F/Vma7
MARVYYIGDEATAAGYRLAGVDTRVPAAEETAEAFQRAVADGAELILLSADRAAELGGAALEAALAGEAPLVAIVSDAYGHRAAPDMAHEVRLALGIEA